MYGPIASFFADPRRSMRPQRPQNPYAPNSTLPPFPATAGLPDAPPGLGYVASPPLQPATPGSRSAADLPGPTDPSGKPEAPPKTPPKPPTQKQLLRQQVFGVAPKQKIMDLFQSGGFPYISKTGGNDY